MRTDRKKTRWAGMKAVLLLAVLAVLNVRAVGAEAADMPADPVYHADTDTTEWSYVYFGSYPQSEVTGEALTEEIVDADYDANGDAMVGGDRYRRLSKVRVNYSSNARSESFYQWDDRTYAYFKYEPIKWRVLENDGSTMLLMADTLLDCRQYNRNDGKVTWDTSNVRSWLNGYSPYNSDGMSFSDMAFTKKELEAVETTVVTGSDNPSHGIDGGADTEDKLFLLSAREVMNPDHGFPADIISYTNTRRLPPSDYAFAMGVWLSTYNEDSYGNGFWLLRTPGSYQQAVSLVYPYGHVYQDGYYADERYYGICPALRVDVESGLWSATYPSPVYGDSNGDGEVTVKDAAQVLETALKLIPGHKDTALQADADGNGQIALRDARLILRKALKIEDTLPVEEGRTNTPPPERQPYQYSLAPLEYPSQQETAASGVIWLAADSIAASHGKSGQQPLYGWGELFGEYFNGNIQVNNTAISGSSTVSFAASSNYKDIMKNMKAGDYLLISFGHNDERGALSLYSDPLGATGVKNSFKWNLKKDYIDPAIEAGATPVLISPVVRRYFLNGEFVDPQLHSAYAAAMKELSEEYAAQGITVPYIGLHEKMRSLYHELGEEGTVALHGMSGGISDNTHLSKEGAQIVCQYIIEEMQKQGLDLCTFLP